MFELPRVARPRTSSTPLSRSSRDSPVTANDWVVSDVGSAVFTSSVPTAAPPTQAWAPRVAIEALVETFHSTRHRDSGDRGVGGDRRVEAEGADLDRLGRSSCAGAAVA